MPRDPKATAMQKVTQLQADYKVAKAHWELLTTKRRKAIIDAVNVGNSKAAVGRAVDVSAARVSALCKEG